MHHLGWHTVVAIIATLTPLAMTLVITLQATGILSGGLTTFEHSDNTIEEESDEVVEVVRGVTP
jgi:hypothetical protein